MCGTDHISSFGHERVHAYYANGIVRIVQRNVINVTQRSFIASILNEYARLPGIYFPKSFISKVAPANSLTVVPPPMQTQLLHMVLLLPSSWTQVAIHPASVWHCITASKSDLHEIPQQDRDVEVSNFSFLAWNMLPFPETASTLHSTYEDT